MANERGTLLDSNMLLDVLTQDPTWASWSGDRLADALDRGPVVINQVVYAEVSLGFTTVEALDVALSADRFVRGNLPWAAAFLAARCFREYRARGGLRTSTLPDFFIGATPRCSGYPCSPGTRGAIGPTSRRWS